MPDETRNIVTEIYKDDQLTVTFRCGGLVVGSRLQDFENIVLTDDAPQLLDPNFKEDRAEIKKCLAEGITIEIAGSGKTTSVFREIAENLSDNKDGWKIVFDGKYVLEGPFQICTFAEERPLRIGEETFILGGVYFKTLPETTFIELLVNSMTSLADRITIDPAICHGKPCIRGLRYPVEVILELLSSGMTMEEIIADYEDLEREDILAVLAFAARLSQVKRLHLVAA
jgi:uncharacterized protein (DUF433 family)